MGGKPVDPANKYPWLVQMRIGDKIGACNGVIFDKKWIITTAVCMDFIVGQTPLQQVSWVTALHNREELDPWSQVVKSAEVVKPTTFQ